MWEGARPSHEALGSMHHAKKKVMVLGERIHIPSGELCIMFADISIQKQR